ncbi:tRNA synthetases class II (A) domain-containing protein [Phthorimaea operculella]|nr:tRNA synthetases class II (A) domain-containing protein [Phthorimaea operculella]
MLLQKAWVRANSSSSAIRSTFIDYFVKDHGHKFVKSSSVVPLCDPSVPFVNAGMNQFKAVFLGTVDPPCPRAVNSQKCIRVGGKHNDLDVVGTDGHHHTFFEMLGNWSFGDYYKKEACRMAWDLLLGPYRLKPDDLVVTYFGGDVMLDIREDRETRDIWKEIGVPASRLKPCNAKDNFWEMGLTGPCGPCTEIHFVNRDGSLTEIWNLVFIQCNRRRLKPCNAKDNFWEMGLTGPCGPCTEIHFVNRDGSLTEIWNLVFIQCNRESDGKVKRLSKQHVDTGMGLERMTTILQGVHTNYDNDLFRPIITAIEKNSKVLPYYGKYGPDAKLDTAYRRLADHARMISVCLADQVFPATSLNLKQILRKSIKMSTDIFRNPNLLPILYDEVASTLGDTYPELLSKQKDAKLILEHEMDNYAKLRSNMAKKWKDLVKQYPEAEAFSGIELAGFPQGYKEFKQTMANLNAAVIPGGLVFKLYDTHGFQEDVIELIAKQNNLEIDKKGFWKLLSEHKARHKTALKEQTSNRGLLFDQTITSLIKDGYTSTDDQPKYHYIVENNLPVFQSLFTKLIAILNNDIERIDVSEPSENRQYYLVTEKTNFYCEEGGQTSDSGEIRFKNGITFKVDSVFKIRDFVFHKGHFEIDENCEKPYVTCQDKVELCVNIEKRLRTMQNHTATHLLNSALRKVLSNSVVCQIGSSVSDRGLSLNLSVYGEKLSQKVILAAQDLVRNAIKYNSSLDTRIIDSVELSQADNILTVPGESYPERGLRLITTEGPLVSRELCCGTHVPSTGVIGDFVITLIKGAGGHTPNIHALTGDLANEARELFCRAQKLNQVIDLIEPNRKTEEVAYIRTQLQELCGSSGAPYGEYAECIALLDSMAKKTSSSNDTVLQSVAEEEVREALAEASRTGRRFIVHFLRCSYLMQDSALARCMRSAGPGPSMIIGCAGGTIIAACRVPQVSGEHGACLANFGIERR